MFKQTTIALTGGAAILFYNLGGEWTAWAPVVGILGQPFWLWETWKSRQLGMFVLSVWYAGAFAYGIWNFWG